MRIATFLPHVGVFGGVRRFVTLGNAWVQAGHHVTLYHSAGKPPEWLPYAGSTAPLAQAASDTSDVAFCADGHTWDAFRAHRSARHVFYAVLERDPVIDRAVADTRVTLAANSPALARSVGRRAGRPVLDGVGGIDTTSFLPPSAPRPQAPLRVLVNGRRSRPKKGTDLVLRALSGLRGVPAFEIVLFDTPGPGDPDPRQGAPSSPNTRWVIGPSQADLVALYQGAHVFIAAERKAGWCNTAIEAMACGCAVACTSSGTTAFAREGETAVTIPIRHPWFIRRAARRLLTDPALRARLAAAGPTEAERWSWPRLANKLLDQLGGVPQTA